MGKIALIGASAFLLALGVGAASAQPRTDEIMKDNNYGWNQNDTAYATFGPNAPFQEGRAAALEQPAPFWLNARPFDGQF